MNLFKERMTKVLKKIGETLLLIFVSLLFLSIICVFVYFYEDFVDKTIHYTLYVVLGVGIVIVLILIIIKVLKFINWLIIEPLKESDRVKVKNDK